jgi:hypothetical protein
MSDFLTVMLAQACRKIKHRPLGDRQISRRVRSGACVPPNRPTSANTPG